MLCPGRASAPAGLRDQSLNAAPTAARRSGRAAGPTGNEGAPQAAHPNPDKADNPSQTLALAFHGDKVYALAFDLEAREFNLFSADNPDYVLGACCRRGRICEELTEGQCAALRGTWQGPQTTCAATDCTYQVCNIPFADMDDDEDVDMADFALLQACLTLPEGSEISDYPVRCSCFDTNRDSLLNGLDIQAFADCAAGPGVPAACD